MVTNCRRKEEGGGGGGKKAINGWENKSGERDRGKRQKKKKKRERASSLEIAFGDNLRQLTSSY